MFCIQIDSEEEKIPEEKYVDELSKSLAQGTDKTPEVLDAALSGLSARYVQFVTRISFTRYKYDCT